ncbi:MAG: helix-turn-helix domain-containing protein [Emergencia timonensis]|uniref:XRE family transcriptional regulator n=1 Tax=Emergencia timonensis TaxID=1776384 RepID=A0A415E4C8_9FIRM|nr:helix-turn-helix transcriptional regulator [Emergencia timonensis]MBS6177891.1 helix-turn-helix transcriptional regulator [Clostridiales bacterium]MCB6476192.1 helix-turn-helix transcriptional regulator [Emergencia timonensis]RHJ88471.1 XRE family transcriptional regulator [Emergencia timonensis]WNX90430.1 helix-turn-helix transcriptional regulator [Emergencia timonensis]BDF08250.1 transcriptional regulator [Emergencia timonensis]
MNDKDKAFELNYEAIGRRIRTARKEEKLTQENLAEKMDISVAHVSGMENGNTGIGIQTLVKASNVLHVSVDWLLHDNLDEYTINFETEIRNILSGCSEDQKKALLVLLKNNRKALDELAEKE